MPLFFAHSMPFLRASPDISALLSLAITVISISRVISVSRPNLSADTPLKSPLPEANSIAAFDHAVSVTSVNDMLESAIFITAPSSTLR